MGRDREGRKGQDMEAVEVEVEVWERGSGAEDTSCDTNGEEGRDEVLACRHEGWKREKKLGESGIEGEDAAVEEGEVEVEVEVKVGREIERVMLVVSKSFRRCTNMADTPGACTNSAVGAKNAE